VPIDEIETILCEEASAILKVEVGTSSNFFEIGGHSLVATKFTSFIGRRLGVRVSVKEVFDYPIISDLAARLRGDSQANQSQPKAAPVSLQLEDSFPEPYELLKSDGLDTFIDREVKPRLDRDDRDLVMDVYPATQVQKLFLQDEQTGLPRTPPVFFIDFPADASCVRLEEACNTLVQYLDILRTVFVEVGGKFFQVLLKELEVPLETYKTRGDLMTATHALRDADLAQPFLLGQSMLRIGIIRKQGEAVRVILRMSHALYDGLSFAHYVEALHVLYTGEGNLKMPPSFSPYIKHMVANRKAAYDYWRSVLKNSKPTVLKASRKTKIVPGALPICFAERQITAPMPANAAHITAATVFTTACALVISDKTRSKDVLFGRSVSGRQCLPDGCQDIVGPCSNDVPCRVLFKGRDRQDLRDAMRAVQNQYLEGMPFETVGFDDLKENCADWPDSVPYYSVCTAFQNFDLNPESSVQEEKIKMQHLAPTLETSTQGEGGDGTTTGYISINPVHDMDMTGVPVPGTDRVSISIGANRKLCDEKTVYRMLEELGDAIEMLLGALKED
jgi:hypothetical protein